MNRVVPRIFPWLLWGVSFSLCCGGACFSDSYGPVRTPYILAGEVEDPLVRLAMRGIRQNYNMDLDGAEEIFQRMIDTFPDHPSGYMCMAGLLEFRMEFEDREEYQERFNEMVKSSLDACKREEKAGRKISGLFFRGGTLGYRGYNRGRRKNYLAAVRDGQGMAKSLRMVLKLDPFCYDAYFGLGLYEYYASKYKSKLDFLPFIGDKREEGIEKLQVCVQRAPLTAIPARASLMWILYEEEQYEEAYGMAQWMTENCPGYWDAYNVQGAARRRQDRKEEACACYRRAIQALEIHLPELEHERVRFHMRLAETLQEMDRSEEAIEEYKIVVGWSATHSKANLHRIDRMRKEAEKRILALSQ